MKILLLLILIIIISFAQSKQGLEIEEEQYLKRHSHHVDVQTHHSAPVFEHRPTVPKITERIHKLREEKHNNGGTVQKSPTEIQKKIDDLKKKQENLETVKKEEPSQPEPKPSNKPETEKSVGSFASSSIKSVLSSGEKGIDVSMYQGDINWSEVKKQGHVTFAFIKATQGTSEIDPDFERNWKGAGEAGIKRGAYCFFDSNEDPIAQAKFFINHAHKGELPPVLDLETTNGESASEMESRALTWLHYVHENFEKPILYTYSSFGDSNLRDSKFANYPLWIADYGPSHPQIPLTWNGHYSLWQYGQGHIAGINGEVDRDIVH